jgi:hypothetical protein
VEHAVIVRLPLDDTRFGSDERRAALDALEEELIDAIALAQAGEFDGNEIGEGECRFFMYGPDADILFMVIEVVLQEFPVARGGFAIKRYGPAEDPESKEVRVTWS